MTDTLTTRHDKARATLRSVNQGHVLHFYDKLDDAGKKQLLDQIDSIDWPEVARLVESHVKHKPEFKLPENVQPAPWYANVPSADLKAKYNQARMLGRIMISRSTVAAFTVAGGQGTRLGWDGPKGSFPATPIRKLSLFGCFAEYILKTQEKFRCTVPWYIMTSPVNDAATREFFAKNQYFGLDPKNVMMFPQGMMPAIGMAGDMAGKVLLEAPDSIALSPNGHGGSLKALYTSGAIDDMKKRGIEQISYTQVDNPIVRVIDPVFLGLHALDQAQMSSKMLPKAYPKEKLGNFCLIDGKLTVIEYSDLPDELAEQRTSDGQLRFLAGSIAIHAMQVDFVESLNSSAGFGLPFHRAEKRVPYLDLNTGRLVKPEKNNAVKLETFVFDALPLCNRSIVYETDRADEFAPIKNADDPDPAKCVDSPYTSKRIQTQRAARWLEQAGVAVPHKADGSLDATLELCQLTAIYPEDLRQGVALPDAIPPGTSLVI